MKSLYEATNGYTGNSYVRCYVWADSDAEAEEMALAAFTISKEIGEPGIDVVKLFSADAEAFVTEPSDDGWDTGSDA